MRTAAILPVKRFAQAKQRLGESVSEPFREDLARAMVCDVLDALHDTPSIEQTIVVSNEQSVALLADQRRSERRCGARHRARFGPGHRTGAVRTRRLPGA